MRNYKYPFTNAIVFSKVMMDPDLCKGLLQWIFPDREIAEVKHHKHAFTVDTEEELYADIDAKSVRLDVLFKDTDAWYDIEMQVDTEPELPHRSRYYHSMMDIEQLDPGDPYNELHDSYVIFLCCYDAFGKNKPIYQFVTYETTLDLPLGDGRYTIVLNSKAESISPQPLQKLFRYMNESIITDNDPLLLKIDDSVRSWNMGKRGTYIMRLDQEMEIRGKRMFKQGHAEGRSEREKEIALKMKQEGVAIDIIMQCTGLKADEIDILE